MRPQSILKRHALRRLPVAAAALLFAALGAPAFAQEGALGVGPPLGSPAPDAQVEDLEGNPVSLSDLMGGGPALIEFWASWCENCEALEPQLTEIHERFGERIAVVAVAVAVGQSRRRVRRHVAAHEPGFPFVYDAAGEAVRNYGALATSVVVLVDAQGRIAFAGVGPEQDLVGVVEKMFESQSHSAH